MKLGLGTKEFAGWLRNLAVDTRRNNGGFGMTSDETLNYIVSLALERNECQDLSGQIAYDQCAMNAVRLLRLPVKQRREMETHYWRALVA